MEIGNKKRGIFSLTFILSLIVGVLAITQLQLPISLFFLYALPIALSVSIFEDRTYLIFSFLLALAALFTSYILFPERIVYDMEFLIGSLILLIVFSEIILFLVERNKKIREKLIESEKKFKRLLNYTYDWEYWIKPDGSIGYSSPSCLKQTGYSPEEFQENKNLILEIVHPDDRALMENHLKNLTTPNAGKIQFRIVTKNGKIRMIRHTCQPIFDEEGNYIGRRASNRNATDRWRAEQALIESEKKYRRIFENLLDVYYRTDLDGTLEIISPSIESISKYKAKELIGKNVRLFYKNKEERERFIEKILKEGRLTDYEVEFRDKDGQIGTLSFNCQLIKDENGKPVAIEGIFHDVTEQKERRRELQIARNRAENYLQVANVMIIVLDKNANIKLINNKGAEILGLPKEEIIGKNWYDNFVPEHRRQSSRESLFENIHKNEVLNNIYESDLIDANGNIKIMLWHTVFLKDENGQVNEILSSGADITEQKKLQDALRKEKEKYQALFEGNLAGVFLSTLEGKILECNKSFAKIFGFTDPEEVKKIHASQLYRNFSDRKDFVEEIKKKKILISKELLMKKKTGEEVWILENVLLVEDNLLQGTLIDITERKKIELEIMESEKRLKELNKIKDKFFSIISHDIRSPFSSLLGYIQIIEDEILPELQGDLSIYLPSMIKSIKNIYDFIEKLLQWSRAQTNRIEINPINLLLYNEIESAYFILKENANYKGIKISNLVDTKIMVYADEEVLRTILRNLISNSIKFTPRNGEIKIFIDEKENHIVIHIQDSGIGMKPEMVEKLFKLDRQTRTRGTENETGSGLGLLLVKELVEKSGGEIWVKSAVGKGSTFSFTVPKVNNIKID